VPIATERSAAKNRYSVTSSAGASGVGGGEQRITLKGNGGLRVTW
jgi:hypothetical protein